MPGKSYLKDQTLRQYLQSNQSLQSTPILGFQGQDKSELAKASLCKHR